MAGLFGKSQTISTTDTKIGALRIQNSSQGLPVPIIFGTTRVTSNLLWYGDFTAIPHTDSQKTGGKGGGGTTTQNTTYTYTAAVIFGLCEGPVSPFSFLGQIWADKNLTTAAALGLAEFVGSYVQNPWTYLTTNHSNQALAYRGDCYAAASAYDLGSSDGLPNLSFEVTGLLGSGDQNPADIITSLLTSDKFGAGWPAASLGDLSDFKAYCTAAGFALSPAYTTQTPMSQILADLVQVGNAGVIWSDSLLKIIPYADTPIGSYTPNLTVQYDLTYDDFIVAGPGTDPVQLDRKRQSDSYNCVRLEILDRSNQYNTYVAEAKDQLAIDLYGLRPMSQISAHAICDTAVGKLVAQTILQRELYVRNVYTFTLGWRYGRLEPMDIVSITDAALNLVKQPVRIISIEEDEEGKLLMMAEELNIGVSTPGSYNTQGTGGSTPANNTPPGNAAVPVMFQPPLALSGTPQIWIGAAGGPNWGGAEVWASADNATFQRMGVLTAPARYGVLTANFPVGVDPDVTNTLQVDLTTSNGVLTSASNAVADALGTLSWIGNGNIAGDEIIAPSTANLTSAFHYSMGNYVRRGQAGSTAQLHLTGSKFMRIDNAVGSFDVATSLMGTTIFVKLLSFNSTGGATQDLADVTSYSFNVATQVVTSGSGYPFYADRTSTANTPAAGFARFNNASQAFATQIYFNDLTAQGANVAAYFASVGSAGFLDLRDPGDTNKWATYTITSASLANSVQTFGITFKAGGAEFPNGDTIVATFSPTPPTGVTSVGLTAPPLFNVSNSPITGAGNLTFTFNLTGTSNGMVPTVQGNTVVWNSQTPSFANQVAATFYAGPVSGANAAPAFRPIALTDLPTTGAANTQILTFANGAVVWANVAAGGGGGIGSIALNMPSTVFTTANSPLTANGTITVTFANQAVNTFFAGPSSGNTAAAPSFRTLTIADVPFVLANPMTAAGDMIVGGANGVATRVAISANLGWVWTVTSANVAGWAAPTGNGGGGGGTTKVTAANVSLGNQTAGQANFTYTSIPSIAARGFVWDFNVSSNVVSLWDVVVRGAGNDSGSMHLQANGVLPLGYRYASPFYWENDAAAQNFYVGIRNRGNISASFTLNFLGVEKTA